MDHRFRNATAAVDDSVDSAPTRIPLLRLLHREMVGHIVLGDRMVDLDDHDGDGMEEARSLDCRSSLRWTFSDWAFGLNDDSELKSCQ